MRYIMFCIAMLGLTGTSAAASYGGKWKGTIEPVSNTCGTPPNAFAVSYKVHRIGSHIYARISGNQKVKRGKASKTGFSFSEGFYKRTENLLCLKRYLWQFRPTGTKSADHILLFTYGCSDGSSCVTAWRGLVKK